MLRIYNQSMSNLFPCFFFLSSAILLSLPLTQMWGSLFTLLCMFFLQQGHLGLTLIQLELLSLYILHSLFFTLWGPTVNPVSLFLLFCVFVGEAALGMSFLVVTSRQTQGELEKFSF